MAKIVEEALRPAADTDFRAAAISVPEVPRASRPALEMPVLDELEPAQQLMTRLFASVPRTPGLIELGTSIAKLEREIRELLAVPGLGGATSSSSMRAGIGSHG